MANQNDLNYLNSISKTQLDRKKDISISTLIEYLDNLGLGLEIRTFSKNNTNLIEEEILLRV